MRSRLLIRPSELRRLNPKTGVYDMPIGNGLFSKERIRSGQQVVHFTGDILATRADIIQAKEVSDHGGYVITNIAQTFGLDCFHTAARHQCFASMANSPYKCMNIVRNIIPRANVQKSCKAMSDGTYLFGLIASEDIKPFTEILVNYGHAYIYPSHYEEY